MYINRKATHNNDNLELKFMVNKYIFRVLLTFTFLIVIGFTSKNCLINNANATSSDYFTRYFQQKLKAVINRLTSEKAIKQAILFLSKNNITPAEFFLLHHEVVIDFAEGHAYSGLIALNKLGVDLKKVDKASNGKLSKIVTRNALIDKVYGQGSEVAQVENLLGLKQYSENDIAHEKYNNSVYQIRIATPVGVDYPKSWLEKKKILSKQELKKYTQWMDYSVSSKPYIHFRPDGVVGISTRLAPFKYTTNVNWKINGSELIVNWYDGVTFKFPFAKANKYGVTYTASSGWILSLWPSWTSNAHNKLQVMTKLSKGEAYALPNRVSPQKIKPTSYKEIVLQKVTKAIQQKQLLGPWRMDPPWVTGHFGVIDFYADGFLAPWFESPKKNIPSLSVLFPNNNKPVYAFGTMFDYWGVTSYSPDSKPVNIAQLHSFVKHPTPKEAKKIRGYTIKKEFDDWQLLDNNILRMSRRFYQVKINNNKLILQAYAVCKKNIKSITVCIQNKIVIKTKKSEVPYWVFKRMEAKQLEEYKIYSTIELLKIIPAPKSDRFKIKSNTRTPDYVSLLKSSKHLADHAISGYMIIDSVVPTWRGPNSTIVNRLSDKLQLAIKLGFGRWLLETKYKGKPVCEGYLGNLKQRVKMERDSKKILQAYCSNSDSKIIKSGTVISEKKKQFPKNKSTSVKPQNESKTRTLVGCWNWANGGYIVINANGKARNGAVKASWKTINSATRHYLITWPPITDTLTLSANGRALKGSNTFGLPISAKRKTGTGSNLSGSWLWNNGMTVDIHPDNTVSAGFFKGRLLKKDKNWIIEWPVNDTITLAANGNSLNLKNQFGALAATRDKNCKKR